MKTILKRIPAFLLIIIMVASMLPITAFAAVKIDVSQPVSMTIKYQKDGTNVSGAYFMLYKVADTNEYANMKLTETFAQYKDSVSGLADLSNLDQDGWINLATTLKGYVLRDGIVPVVSGDTDENGNIVFSDLNVGLYLVIGDRRTIGDYTYSVAPFMAFLPGEDYKNNSWIYDYNAEIAPKSSKEKNPDSPSEDFVSCKAIKVWDDEGYESIRPNKITVNLLCDGEIYDTQVLNKKNNWRYEWKKLNADHDWEVVEDETENYVVSVSKTGITFIITNKYVVHTNGINIPVQKRITGDKPKKDSTFTFYMKALDENNPMPEGSNGTEKQISIKGAGSAKFGEITFAKPGIYEYTINEKIESVKGYTYDTEVYTVKFNVTQKNSELSIKSTITNNSGKKVSKVEFTNKYKTPPEDVPSTGMLWWPVPVLFCIGLILLTVGFLRRRRYE